MASDPIGRVRRWLTAARRVRDALPEAVALATSSTDGRPVVRFVLLAGCDDRGFVFCCSAKSRKVDEIVAVPRAALAVYWHRAGRQARIEGSVVRIGTGEVDRCWRGYSRQAQLAHWAAHESPATVTRAELASALRRVERRFRGRVVPRPASWIGYRIVPEAIELWRQHPRHLHERERFERRRRGWSRRMLVP